MSRPLTPLLAPRSIAIVGASPSPEKAGYQALRALADFPGPLYPIHPSVKEVLGHRAYPSIEAIGAPVDLALLAIPARACPQAMREAAMAGSRAALIVSGGFGESGESGEALQAALAAVCRETGIRLLGPNTSGFVNAPERCSASFAPGVDELRPGNIAIVAQSGGVNLTLAFQVHALGLGVSVAVGLGNMVDVDAADAIDHLAADPATRVIALHLEGIGYGRKLYETLRRVTPYKPVVALVVGRADVGEFAQSHTGNLIGSHARKAAALAQAGAVVVESTDALADAAAALSRSRLQPSAEPGIAIVTGQAGPGLIMVDQLKQRGASVPELEPDTVARIAGLLPPLTYMRNPVDTGRPGPSFPEVLAVTARDPNVDAIVCFTLHEPAAVDPVAALSAAARLTPKPLLFGTMGTPGSITPTLSALVQLGIPAYPSPERVAAAAGVLAADARAAWRVQRSVESLAGAGDTAPSSTPAAGPLDEDAAKTLLARYGIATPRRVACASRAEAHAAFERLAKPVVVKILAAEIAHKTEVGGVKLGIASAAALDAALDALDAIALDGRRRYLVEETAPPGVEIIIGAVRDPSFGPLVMVGLGGTTAEALEDVAIRLVPLAESDALEMLGELRGAALLDGWRGAPAVARIAIAQAIVAVGRLLLEHPSITELDLNPVRAYPQGVLALDALVIG